MHVKGLNIYGFKSFSDKIKMEFKPGISAIVGPNGSGKSNIADAIRWVLGEQSTKLLRGSKMEDLIFAGNDVLKPLSLSEVTLILDNTDEFIPVDYSEIMITRRVYRSGESEYYLNKTACRLKDIIELLMDTGIGKEGYSIIGQGRIDEILSAKTEDRRKIIEEAAGIVKYKTRKSESEKKISDTENNIIRLNDLIEELNYQLEPKRLEAEKAYKYNSINNLIKTNEIALIVNKLIKLERKIEDYEIFFEEQKHKQNRLAQNEVEIEKELDTKKSEISNIDTKLFELQEKRNSLSSSNIILKNQIEGYKERTKSLDKIIENDISNLKELKSKKIIIVKSIEDERSKLNETTNKLNTLENEMMIKSYNLDELDENIQFKEDSLDKNRDLLVTLSESINSYEKEFSHLNLLNNELEKQMRNIEKEMKELSLKSFDLIKKININNREIDRLKGEIKKNNEKNKHLIKKAEDFNQELIELQKNEQIINKNLNNYSSKLNILNKMENEFQGHYKGFKKIISFIKNENSLKRDFHGAISQIIKAKKENEIAIETALGVSINHIITTNEETAQKIINHIKQNKIGRVTILPINTIKPKELTEKEKKCLKISGAIEVASNLVDYEHKFNNIIHFLLGRVLVAKDLKTATKIGQINRFSFRIVTLDGDVINTGGAMTGGIQAKQNFVLSRKREINEMIYKAKKKNEEKKQIENKINTLNEKLKEINFETDKIKEHNHRIELEIGKLQKENEEIIKNKKEVDKKEKDQSNNLFDLKEEKKSNNRKMEGIKANLDLIILKKDNLEKEINNSKKFFNENKQYKNNLSKEITGLKIEIASLKQQIMYLKDSINKKQDESSMLDNNIEKTSKEIDKNKIEHNRTIGKIDQQSIVLKEKEKSIKNIDHIIEKQKNIKDNTRTDLNKIENNLKNCRRHIKKTQDDLHKKDVEYTKLFMHKQNSEDKLWEKYNIGYADALKYKDSIKNEAEADILINDLKNKINELGDVNLGSIDEYKRLKERHDYLNEQKKDLEDAKRFLNKVIDEVTKKMENNFMNCFKSLNYNFEQVFKELFDGGKAYLKLEDDLEILDSGIEIHAQPPGKKMQNLTLLSGGERALTAIALLFAVLRYRPTPFCVLDEIEASLDDNNVERFTKYLTKFSKNTQFIVITHKKQVMEASQILYGVTVEDSKSKLISVKLDYEKNI